MNAVAPPETPLANFKPKRSIDQIKYVVLHLFIQLEIFSFALILASVVRLIMNGINFIFRKWGFRNYLNELFTAPDAVMRYLCENCRIHEIPLGNELTQKHADEVLGVVTLLLFLAS